MFNDSLCLSIRYYQYVYVLLFATTSFESHSDGINTNKLDVQISSTRNVKSEVFINKELNPVVMIVTVSH